MSSGVLLPVQPYVEHELPQAVALPPPRQPLGAFSASSINSPRPPLSNRIGKAGAQRAPATFLEPLVLPNESPVSVASARESSACESENDSDDEQPGLEEEVCALHTELFEAEVRYLRERDAKERAEARVRGLEKVMKNVAPPVAVRRVRSVSAATQTRAPPPTVTQNRATQTFGANRPAVFAMRAAAPAVAAVRPRAAAATCSAGVQTDSVTTITAVALREEKPAEASAASAQTSPIPMARPYDGPIAHAKPLPKPVAWTVDLCSSPESDAGSPPPSEDEMARPEPPLPAPRAAWHDLLDANGSPIRSAGSPASSASASPPLTNKAARRGATPVRSTPIMQLRDGERSVVASPDKVVAALMAMQREKEAENVAKETRLRDRIYELEEMLASVFPELRSGSRLRTI